MAAEEFERMVERRLQEWAGLDAAASAAAAQHHGALLREVFRKLLDHADGMPSGDARIRELALEEAAQVCERWTAVAGANTDILLQVAARIRALKQQPVSVSDDGRPSASGPDFLGR